MVTPIDTRVELDLNGSWTDITDYVYDRGRISISRGRSGEGARVDPSRCTVTVNNRDGRFSPRNPVGAYYGQIGRNTPIRVSVPYGETYLRVPRGQTTDSIRTPDAAVLDITGDIDIRIFATFDSWRMGHGLAAKYNATGDNRSWALSISDEGFIQLFWSPDGTLTNRLFTISDTVVPRRTGPQAIRVTLDVNNGSSGNTTTFYTADSMDGPWVQLGDTAIGSGTTSIFSGNGDVEVGSAFSVAGSCLGKIHAFELRNGIDGTVVANPDFSIQTAGATSFADTTTSPRTWTVAGSATLDDRDYRFHGEVSSWPQRSDLSGQDVYVPIEASGVLRRLEQGSSPLRSTMYRAMVASDNANPPLAYWPCEDGSASTQIASGLWLDQPMKVYNEQPNYASFSGFNCSQPLPTVINSQWEGDVSPYTANASQQVRFLFYAETANNSERIFTVYTLGSVTRLALFYGTGGTLDLRAYDADFNLLASTGAVAFALDGKLLRLSIEFTQSGSDVEFGVVALEVGQTSGTFASATATNQTIGRVHRVGTNAGGGIASSGTEVAYGHISVHNEITSIFDLDDELKAYDGETAGDRIARLCAEENVDFELIGAAADTEAMGPQRPRALTDLIRECADTDLGVLLEPKDALGLRYRTRADLYNRNATLTLDYASHQLADSLDPVDDDQFTRNDITVTRPDGSSYRAVQETGRMSVEAPPNGAGRYDDSVSPNVETDEQLADQAGWRLHLGTVDEARYPKIRVDLRHASFEASETLRRAARGVDTGDRLVVSGAPSWLPPDDISQLVVGYAEDMTGFTHSITFNCVPESPYRVGELNDEVLGRVDSDASELYEAVTSSATTINVTPDLPTVWTVDTDDFPFDIVVGGEVMTVTEIQGADGDFIHGVSDWSGVSCTLAHSTTAYGAPNGCQMTVTGTPTQAYFRPNQRAAVGDWPAFETSMWVMSTTGLSGVFAAIDWFDASGNYLATNTGPSTTLTANVWTKLWFRSGAVTPPVGGVSASYGPTISGSPATGTVLYVSKIRFNYPGYQTFEVTRSVNGVVKSHSAGADVRLLQPMIVSL